MAVAIGCVNRSSTCIRLAPAWPFLDSYCHELANTKIGRPTVAPLCSKRPSTRSMSSLVVAASASRFQEWMRAAGYSPTQVGPLAPMIPARCVPWSVSFSAARVQADGAAAPTSSSGPQPSATEETSAGFLRTGRSSRNTSGHFDVHGIQSTLSSPTSSEYAHWSPVASVPAWHALTYFVGEMVELYFDRRLCSSGWVNVMLAMWASCSARDARCASLG